MPAPKRRNKIVNFVENKDTGLTVFSTNLFTSPDDDYVPVSTLYYKDIAPKREEAGYDEKFKVPTGPDEHPPEFNWNDPKDVATKRFENKITETQAASLIHPVVDQSRCGSCWAVSTASMFADRVAIAQLKPNISLSATELLSCVNAKRNLKIHQHSTSRNKNSTKRVTIQSLDCCGGFPLDACEHIEEYGLGTSASNPYDAWCCHGVLICDVESGQDIDQMDPPACPIRGRGHIPRGERVKAKNHSTRTVEGIENIKEAVFHEGPVVAAFVVYSDFEFTTVSPTSSTSSSKIMQMETLTSNGKNDNNQKQTSWPNDIYIKDERKAINGGPAIQGGHAVVIVGWGVDQKVPEPSWWAKLKPTLRWNPIVPYWIVRNSWGTQWGLNGYFKMAMNQAPLHLNNECGLDIPTTMNNIGGTITLLPDVDYNPIHAQISIRTFDIKTIEEHAHASILESRNELEEEIRNERAKDRNIVILSVSGSVVLLLVIFLLVWFLVVKKKKVN